MCVDLAILLLAIALTHRVTKAYYSKPKLVVNRTYTLK